MQEYVRKECLKMGKGKRYDEPKLNLKKVFGTIITILVILYPHIKRGVDELFDDLLFIVKGLLLMLTIAIAKIIRKSKKIV